MGRAQCGWAPWSDENRVAVPTYGQDQIHEVRDGDAGMEEVVLVCSCHILS